MELEAEADGSPPRLARQTSLAVHKRVPLAGCAVLGTPSTLPQRLSLPRQPPSLPQPLDLLPHLTSPRPLTATPCSARRSAACTAAAQHGTCRRDLPRSPPTSAPLTSSIPALISLHLPGSPLLGARAGACAARRDGGALLPLLRVARHLQCPRVRRCGLLLPVQPPRARRARRGPRRARRPVLAAAVRRPRLLRVPIGGARCDRRWKSARRPG